MSDNLNPSGSGSETLLDKANLFYNSEPLAPTDEDEDTTVEAEEVETDETEEEESVSHEPASLYEFDEESGTYSFKSNGQKVQANIDKLIENYSKGEGFTQKTTELAKEKKALKAEIEAKKAEVSKQADYLNAIADELTKSFLNEEKQIDWEDLRDRDIAEYTRQRERQTHRQNVLQKALAAVDQQKKDFEQNAINQSFLELSSMLGWEDEAKKTDDTKKMEAYFKQEDIPREAFKGVYHPKIYKMALDAAKYAELKASTKNAVKKVKSAPKSVNSKKPAEQAKEQPAWQVLYGA